MSNAEKKPQIDDVLSSIKRLVSDEASARNEPNAAISRPVDLPEETDRFEPEPDDAGGVEEFEIDRSEATQDKNDRKSALILTPALRIIDGKQTDDGDEDVNEAQSLPDTDVDSILRAISREAFPEFDETDVISDDSDDSEDPDPGESSENSEEAHADGDALLAGQSKKEAPLVLEAAQSIDENAADELPSAGQSIENHDNAILDDVQGDGDGNNEDEFNIDDQASADQDVGEVEDDEFSDETLETVSDDDAVETSASHDEKSSGHQDSEFYENEHFQDDKPSGADADNGLNINLDAILGRASASQNPQEASETSEMDIKSMTKAAIEAEVMTHAEESIEDLATKEVNEEFAEETTSEITEEADEWQDSDTTEVPQTDAIDDAANDVDMNAGTAAEIVDDANDPLDDGAEILDEAMLRDLVGQYVREELQGSLGERITRNVRKLVRREIHRVLESQEFE